MTTIATGARRPIVAAPAAGFGAAFARLADALKRRAEESRAIGELESMSDRELSDIGIARADIRRVVRGRR